MCVDFPRQFVVLRYHGKVLNYFAHPHSRSLALTRARQVFVNGKRYVRAKNFPRKASAVPVACQAETMVSPPTVVSSTLARVATKKVTSSTSQSMIPEDVSTPTQVEANISLDSPTESPRAARVETIVSLDSPAESLRDTSARVETEVFFVPDGPKVRTAKPNATSDDVANDEDQPVFDLNSSVDFPPLVDTSIVCNVAAAAAQQQAMPNAWAVPLVLAQVNKAALTEPTAAAVPKMSRKFKLRLNP